MSQEDAVRAAIAQLDAALAALRALDASSRRNRVEEPDADLMRELSDRLELVRRVASQVKKGAMAKPKATFRQGRGLGSSLTAERRAAKAAYRETRATLERDRMMQTEHPVDWALGVLGESLGASPDALRTSYRALLRKTHPDLAAAAQRIDSAGAGGPSKHSALPAFADVQKAWDICREAGLVP